MQGSMILASIGTEKDTSILLDANCWRTDGLTDRRTDGRREGRTDGKLNSYIAPCYKQVR